ncbi:hypothetical protein BDW60DRAFT_141181 [Aspergillus nidulans var. acristatus]
MTRLYWAALSLHHTRLISAAGYIIWASVEASLALRSLSVSAVYEDSRANFGIWDRKAALPDKQDDFIESRYEKSNVHPRYYATLISKQQPDKPQRDTQYFLYIE